jgi:ribonuclease Z
VSRDAVFAIETARFTIEGSSSAGVETWFRVKELGIALDIGRCPDQLVAVPNVFITHAHIDHSLGVPFYAAQRKLQRLEPGRVYVPAEALEDYRRLIAVHESLQSTIYQLELAGLEEGDRVQVRRGLEVRTHRASHRIPANAYEVVELRRKLRAEHLGMESRGIRQLGDEAFDMVEIPLLFYTGDTDRRIFESVPSLFNAEVLIIECTFTHPEDRDRAEQHAHIHLDDLVDVADRFENGTIVLTHFSRRDSPQEIEREVMTRLPERIRERIRLAM